MPRVPTVSNHDADNLSEDVLQVTSLEVAHANDRPVLVLTAKFVRHGKPDAAVVELALSPPAAAQLARLLEQSIESYLYPNLNVREDQ